MASRLQGFVKREGSQDDHRKSNPPPSTQPQSHQRQVNPERLSALASKVRHSEKASFNPRPSDQKLLSTTPTPSYSSNPNPTGRNTFTNSQYQQAQQYDGPPASTREIKAGSQYTPHEETPHEEPPVRGNTFDDTITSSLEDTKSDLQYKDEPHGMGNHDEGLAEDNGYGRRNEELQHQYRSRSPRQHFQSYSNHSNQHPQRVLSHQKSRSPLVDAGHEQQPNAFVAPMTPSIAGRFASAGEHWQQDVPLRNNSGPSIDVGHPNDLDLFNETDDDNDGSSPINGQKNSYQEGHMESEGEEVEFGESPEDIDLPKHQDGRNGHHLGFEGGQYGNDLRSEGAESRFSVSHRQARREDSNIALRARDEAQDRFKPSRTDEELASMTYADLKKETWDDKKPIREKRPSPTQTQDDKFSMKNYAINVISEAVQKAMQEHADPEVHARAQAKMFAEMTMEEYEESGDFFIGKFAELMNRIKEARRKKRNLTTKFENEIEAREQAVRGKSEILEQKFNDMRAGGEGVLKGKV